MSTGLNPLYTDKNNFLLNILLDIITSRSKNNLF